jgi:SulP family sulfate permease
MLPKHLFDRRSAVRDGMAGVTLGITSIPDAMASALLAAVNPIYGLNAVMLATPIGALFAGSVYMSVQTTSAMSLLVSDVPGVRGGVEGDRALFMLAILTGVFMLTAGLLKLGRLLRFVPNSVMTGFINGVAILIILGQLGDFTGYSAEGSNKVTQTVDLALNLGEADLRTVAVGVAAILLILILEQTRLKSFGIVVALIVASALVPLLGWDSIALVGDVADIPDSFPRPVLPAFSAILALVIPALSLAFVGLVQGAGVSQAYKNPDGEYPDESRDFVGQGAANLAAGLFQGMPVGGSLSATSLVKSAGARTRFANIVAGVTIAIVLLLFGGAVGALAMPALAGLLIVIGYQTLKPDDIRLVWHTGLVQRTVMTITFVLTLLLPLQYAVLAGVALAIVLHVVRQSNRIVVREWKLEPGKPPVETDPPRELGEGQVVVLVPYGSLFYAAAQVFENQLPEVTDETQNSAVILEMRGRDELGSTLVGVLETYQDKLEERGSSLYIADASEALASQLEQTEGLRIMGIERVFKHRDAVGESAMRAADVARRAIDESEDEPVRQD